MTVLTANIYTYIYMPEEDAGYLQLKLQTAVSCHVVLGTEPGSSTRAARAKRALDC